MQKLYIQRSAMMQAFEKLIEIQSFIYLFMALRPLW